MHTCMCLYIHRTCNILPLHSKKLKTKQCNRSASEAFPRQKPLLYKIYQRQYQEEEKKNIFKLSKG